MFRYCMLCFGPQKSAQPFGRAPPFLAWVPRLCEEKTRFTFFFQNTSCSFVSVLCRATAGASATRRLTRCGWARGTGRAPAGGQPPPNLRMGGGYASASPHASASARARPPLSALCTHDTLSEVALPGLAHAFRPTHRKNNGISRHPLFKPPCASPTCCCF